MLCSTLGHIILKLASALANSTVQYIRRNNIENPQRDCVETAREVAREWASVRLGRPRLQGPRTSNSKGDTHFFLYKADVRGGGYGRAGVSVPPAPRSDGVCAPGDDNRLCTEIRR